MPTIETAMFDCPRCGNKYEDIIRGHFSGKPCKECNQLIIKLGSFERQLIAQEFSIEREDEEIARQMNDLLVKEGSGNQQKDERLLTALAERMLADEKRREKIIRQILVLQKRKR